MENASKALIMAAGVLIGVLILSLAVYLFIDFGTKSAELHKQITLNQLTQFNAQFNVYDGREDVTIYEIISLVNLAKENNENNKNMGSDYKIEIWLKNGIVTGNKNITNITETEKLDHITKLNKVEQKANGNIEPIYQYSCKVEYHENGRVSKVSFE